MATRGQRRNSDLRYADFAFLLLARCGAGRSTPRTAGVKCRSSRTLESASSAGGRQGPPRWGPEAGTPRYNFIPNCGVQLMPNDAFGHSQPASRSSSAPEADVATYGFATRAIRTGQDPCDATGSTIVPVYQTATFTQAAGGVTHGFDYLRSGN